ncbi:MAG: glutathione S-transferase family protein [Coleofasciculaceae cyanobacterium SM2_1_6]|nr:glutathione S-transferase family protein [Coleofasciculaceae cyanobacterium SM2_1_6]
MAIELYQFEMSQYSEKVRMILDFKGLPYKKIEVTPGVGQLEVFRMSGQRQLPVLKDGSTVIADSTAIAFYLEKQYPEKPIIPSDPKKKGLCLMMEEWADESIGTKSRKVLFGALSQNQNFRTSILPSTTPDFVKTFVGSVPTEVFDVLGIGVGLGSDAIKSAQDALKQDLEALCLILSNSPYLVGDQPTLADLSVASLSILLKYPEGNYINIPEPLKGKGIPGIADNPDYEVFFSWRDRLYQQYRQPLGIDPNTDPSPNRIEID